MARVKGKLLSGGNRVQVGRRVHPIEPVGKGNILNLPSGSAVEGTLVPGPTGSGLRRGTGQSAMLFRPDKKHLKRPTIA